MRHARWSPSSARYRSDRRDLTKDRDLLLAPATVVIPAVAQALAGSPFALGAQNMHWEDSGAFTGEVSRRC